MFAEPGYFLITPKNVIRYMTISSSPVGGRVDIDTGDFIYVYICLYIHSICIHMSYLQYHIISNNLFGYSSLIRNSFFDDS
jgi:hypothetical protein